MPGWDQGTNGYGSAMTIVVIILIVLALVIGLGALLEGLAWLLLITLALLAGAAILGRKAFSGR